MNRTHRNRSLNDKENERSECKPDRAQPSRNEDESQYAAHIHTGWALQRQELVVAGLAKRWPPAVCRALPVMLKLLEVMQYIHRQSRPPLLALVS